MLKTLEPFVDRITPDREEAALRIVIALAGVAFFCLSLPAPFAHGGLAVCGAYTLASAILFAVSTRATGTSVFRRTLGLAADQLGVTCALWVAGPHAAPLLFGYLWIILGASMRHGIRWGAATAGCAVLALGALVLHEPGWRDPNGLATAWLVSLAIVPVYTAVLNARVVKRFEHYREHSKQLAIAATHDKLTGLPNRDHFERALESALGQLRSAGEGALAVLFVDLDGFKTCNDLHGHAAGDELLRMIANDLRSSIRTTDMAARFGGDEFAILLTGLRSVEDAARIVSTILRRAQEVRTIAGQTIRISASAGISYLRAADSQEVDCAAIIACADRAMLRAKRGGKNTFRVATAPHRVAPDLDLLSLGA